MAQSSFLEKDSPVDFLYLDRQRVSSLIGQLSDRGMLTGLKSFVSKTHTKEGTAGGNIGVKAEGKLARTSSESSEETYDPFWAHVYTFLQDLESNFAVPLDKARMGSLIKFSALIQFLDLKIMRNLWEPAGRIFLQSQKQEKADHPTISRQQRRAKQRRQEQPAIPDAVKLGFEVMKEIPHLLHMTFMSSCEQKIIRLWAAAQPDYLTINSGALVMKYGAVLSGLWTVVGILDAAPGPPPEPWPLNPLLDGVVSAMANLRGVMGRPKDHFGITPIAIYAPLQGAAEAEIESQPETTLQTGRRPE